MTAQASQETASDQKTCQKSCHVTNSVLGLFETIGGMVLGFFAMVGRITDFIARSLKHESGAVAELLGQFFDIDGQQIETEFDQRVMAPSIDSLKGREVTAIAGGANKVKAITAALKSGHLTGLLTDEVTAKALVEDHE